MTPKSTPKKANKGTFLRLIKLVFSINGFKLLIVLGLMILATISNITAMSQLQKLIIIATELKQTSTPWTFSAVQGPIFKMIIFYSFNVIGNYAFLRIMINVGQDTLLHIRTTLFEHMLKLPLNYFDTNKHGDLMSRYTNDVDATRQMVSQSLPQLTVSIIMIIGYFIAMVLTNWILSIITLAISVTLIFITRMIAYRSKKYFAAQQKEVGALNGYVEEMISGQKVVKVFRHEKAALEDFEKLNQKVYEANYISARRTGMLLPITINAGFLSFAVAAIAGSILIKNGLLAVPALIVYLLYTRNFTGPINQMGQQLNFVQLALAGASRVFEIFDLPPEVDEGKVRLVNVKVKEENELEVVQDNSNMWAWRDGEKLIPLHGDVRFKDVDFGYNGDKLVLKNISLFAKPGQKIAFVGATGAGKTTISNLINRFYDIHKGEILIDGINVKNIAKSSLRNSLGVVLQDTHLFSISVADNIRYGKLDATEEEIIEAAKLAYAHEFITKLPQGYATVLSDDGANLSEGQRQLIAIARAAISNPPVLILDEATSSIDTYTERIIQKGMDNLMKNRTVFVIAHRLSTIKNAKAIILLEQGEIKERGNHADLIDLRGTYYQLYTGAFELE